MPDRGMRTEPLDLEPSEEEQAALEALARLDGAPEDRQRVASLIGLLSGRVDAQRRGLIEARALLATAYDDFNGEGSASNSWRIRVENLGAWPRA